MLRKLLSTLLVYVLSLKLLSLFPALDVLFLCNVLLCPSLSIPPGTTLAQSSSSHVWILSMASWLAFFCHFSSGELSGQLSPLTT